MRILGREKIPLSWDERAKTDGPIIGIGGALTYINPLIFSGLADFVVLGDGETALRAVVKAVREAISYSRRDKLWADLSDHPSIYVPAVHNTLIDNGVELGKVRGHCPSLGDLLGHSLWLTPHAAFGKTLLVELQRGVRDDVHIAQSLPALGVIENNLLKLSKKKLRRCSAAFPSIGLAWLLPRQAIILISTTYWTFLKV